MKKKPNQSKRRIKPSEAFSVGPLQVRRFGRVIELRNNLSPAAFDKMRSKFPQRREELRQEIQKKVNEIVALLTTRSALHLMHSVVTANCFVVPETYSEPEQEGNEAFAEYAQSVAMAISTHATTLPSKTEQQLFNDNITSIYECTYQFFALEDRSIDKAPETTQTKFLGKLRQLYIRGSGIFEHETELLIALFSPHDAFFVRNGFPSVVDFLQLCADCTRRVDEEVNKSISALQSFRELDKQVKAGALSVEDAKTRAKELENPNIDGSTAPLLLDPLLSHVVPLDETTRGFCEQLSLRPGDNADFLGFLKSPGWPLNSSEIYARPLIQVDQTYYCINPVLLNRNRAVMLEDFIHRSSPDYYQKQYATKRGKAVEALAIDYLGALLPGASIFPNLFYDIAHNGLIQRFEADAIIVLDDYLFLVEMKSAPFSEAALRGAEKSLSRDLRHLIEEPYQQARRTLEFARANPKAQFVFANGAGALELELNQFRRIYLLNVTLADISHVSSRLNSARGMGFIGEAEWPWSVHLLDLRVVSELLASPSEFILYLERRLELNDLPAISGSDELNYLGFFLRMGLYFTHENVKGLNMVSLGNFSVDIDRYYDHIAGRVSTGERPRLNISAWYRALVALTEACDARGRYYVASQLLALDGDDQERVEEWFRTAGPSAVAKLRSITFIALRRNTVFFTISAGSTSRHYPTVVNYVTIKRAQTSGRPLVWIDIAADMSAVEFAIHEYAHQGLNPIQQKQLARSRQQRLIAHIQQSGMPGRNDPCPCGSGAKFKRCCIDLVDED